MSERKIELLPHNEEAYIKLIECLKDNQLVGLNHATGTGKSFIILKYLYENRKKRILFLSPSYPINEQLIEEHAKDLDIDIEEFECLDTLIYRSLLKMDMKELASKYDIIILDEYHRCGAKEWGKKVNELLDIIKKEHSEVKVIGTTATEIRYLDNEKNMNNILFDGVCASTLTLADAMLREILPVPTYVNSAIELSSEYEKILRKVHKNSLYNAEKKYYLGLVAGVRTQIDMIVSKEEDISKYIKRDGKHLVFSSTIDNISKNKKTINYLLNNKHNEYEVHSKKPREVNSKALNDFRYDSDPAVLYCVNILNEGVHVKGVDSIFMLRPTISPIIFFQQLGRLLSYSKRKDKVVVFDLVNNIRQSPHIYKLYIDLYKRASELMESDPQNKERYMNIVNSFKIVDATSRVYEKIDILKKALLRDNFYKKRIDFVIDILTGKIKVDAVEENFARMDLFKYYKYITVEQFDAIKDINVNKPSIFNLSREEFLELLSGEENLYNKEKKKIMIIISNVNDFYDEKGYFPSILSKDAQEASIAQRLIRIYDAEDAVENVFENKSISNLTEYEKIVYQLTNQVNVELLYKEIDELIENKMDINPLIFKFIQKDKTSKGKKYFEKILKYNFIRIQNGLDNIEMSNEELSQLEAKNLKMMYTNDYKRIAVESMREVQESESLEAYLKNLADQIVAYISEYKRMPVYYSAGNDKEKLKVMRDLYVRKMIFYGDLDNLGYINLFDEVYNSVQLELAMVNKDNVVAKLIEFLKEHNGDMPSLNIEEDKELAQEVSKAKKFFQVEDIEMINSYIPKERTKEVVLKYIAFVKKYKRYPLITSNDESEKMLLEEYLRNERSFSESDKLLLNKLKKIVSSSRAMQNAYSELLKQKNRR